MSGEAELDGEGLVKWRQGREDLRIVDGIFREYSLEVLRGAWRRVGCCKKGLQSINASTKLRSVL